MEWKNLDGKWRVRGVWYDLYILFENVSEC